MDLLILLLLLVPVVKGQITHEILVTYRSYANPSGRCVSCGGGTAPGCCDVSTPVPQDQSCQPELCDTALTYCFRPLGSTSICTLMENDGTLGRRALLDSNSTVVRNDFFGISNPVSHSRSDPWPGQLQILHTFLECLQGGACIVDYDMVIDRIPINFHAIVGLSIPETTYNGIAGIAQLRASIVVRCAPNYYGRDCTTQCSELMNCAGCGLSGFTGQFCQFSIDECSDVYCNGNGNCTEGSSLCNCVPGFTGERCQTDIDECVGVDCSNNGQCVDEVNGFRCQCNAGFTDNLCGTNINDCEGINCNSGICVDELNDFSCNCATGFTGDRCNGTCVDLVNGFRCDCIAGFTGKLCLEVSVGIGDTVLIVVGVLLGAFLVAIIIIIVIAIVIVRSKTRDMHTSTDIQGKGVAELAMISQSHVRTSFSELGVESVPMTTNEAYGTSASARVVRTVQLPEQEPEYAAPLLKSVEIKTTQSDEVDGVSMVANQKTENGAFGNTTGYQMKMTHNLVYGIAEQSANEAIPNDADSNVEMIKNSAYGASTDIKTTQSDEVDGISTVTNQRTGNDMESGAFGTTTGYQMKMTQNLVYGVCIVEQTANEAIPNVADSKVEMIQNSAYGASTIVNGQKPAAECRVDEQILDYDYITGFQ